MNDFSIRRHFVNAAKYHDVALPLAANATLYAELEQALLQEQLRLFYQPIVDLQSGAIIGVETSMGWQHPVQGLLSGSAFLPQAGEIGLSAALWRWLFNRACSDLSVWLRDGKNSLRVAVQIGPDQLCDAGCADAVAGILENYGIQPCALTLRVTETALAQAGTPSADLLSAVRRLGIGLALDDFGAHHSSLRSLKCYPFDAIRIDAQLIADVISSGKDAAMAKGIIAMAHQLGMKVAAEGVNTEAQCDFLRRNMCDQIQGNFFAPPLHLSALTQLLTAAPLLPAHLLRMHKPRRRLLLVDDELNILSALKRLLRSDGYEIHTANNGPQGLESLVLHPVDVIVSDQRMPGMLGADFLRKARQLAPDTIRIMLSGYTELQSVTDAVNEGAIYKFLTKPWDDTQLRGHIADAFRIKEIADDNQRLHLEVRSANQELAAANRHMEQLLQEKQLQICRDEVSLNVARELLQQLPLAVIGLDDAGMIAFINGAAEALFRHSGALLGNQAGSVLPELFPPINAAALVPGHPTTHMANIDCQRYLVVHHPMGARSASRGSLIVLSKAEVSA